MRYVALGDSISIDAYTGVPGGGAPSQLARRLEAELVDLTLDGNTTDGVLSDLERAPAQADVVTLTAGGNDLLGGKRAAEILGNLAQIAERLAAFRCPVVMNTVYDPTDGDDELARELLGLLPELRAEFDALNRGIEAIARERGFLLADLEALFHGHGLASADPWYVAMIEPNLAGATAIAERWFELLRGARSDD